MTYTCEYCSQYSFEIKNNYNKHIVQCQLTHKSQKEKQNTIESISPKLTPTELNRIVLQLVYKNEKLEKRLKKAEEAIANLRKREKITILQTLNSDSFIKPEKTLKEWIQSITISISHLEMAFQTDLIQGIQLCIKEAILESDITQLPFCAFIQRPKHLFMFQESETQTIDRRWKMVSCDEMQKINNILSYRFLRAYLHMNNTTIREKYADISDIEWKEKDMLFTTKIMGQDIPENMRSRKLQDYFIQLVQRDLEDIGFE